MCQRSYGPATHCILRSWIFLGHGGQSVTRSNAHNLFYLSQKYGAEDWKHLEALAVVEITFEKFLKDFKDCMATNQAEFQIRSHGWHSRLAVILNDHKEALPEIPLIPLRDGR
jgi:hypothetical protein